MSQKEWKAELGFEIIHSVRLGSWGCGKEEVLNGLNINLATVWWCLSKVSTFPGITRGRCYL